MGTLQTGSVRGWLNYFKLNLRRGEGLVGMGQAAGEVVLLEAMEATAHAPPSSARAGGLPRPGPHGDAEP